MKYTFALFLLTGIATTLFSQNKNPESMLAPKPNTILILMNATPQWLSLSRDERSKFFEKSIVPIFQKVGETVSVRFFDSEYFHSRVSDFMIIETGNMEDYKLFIELLRDTKVYAVPYFEVVDIIVGQENAFQDFNALFKKEQ